jgi:phosphoribosyl-dephospho-CoA transferase
MSDAAVLGALGRRWNRHELVRLAPRFWESLLRSQPAIAALPYLTGWADRGWPVIVRRWMDKDIRPHMVPVGVPLPPLAGKQRISLLVPEDAVLARSRPPSLWSIKGLADASRQPTIDALLVLGERRGVAPAAFGSLLWQYETGLPYLSPRSDLDVLWPVKRHTDIDSLLAGIADAEKRAPMRIDGEILFPNGSAVNWREFHMALNQSRAAEVLVKSMDGVRLVHVDQLLSRRKAA